jgi:hypothetical protein
MSLQSLENEAKSRSTSPVFGTFLPPNLGMNLVVNLIANLWLWCGADSGWCGVVWVEGKIDRSERVTCKLQPKTDDRRPPIDLPKEERTNGSKRITDGSGIGNIELFFSFSALHCSLPLLLLLSCYLPLRSRTPCEVTSELLPLLFALY